MKLENAVIIISILVILGVFIWGFIEALNSDTYDDTGLLDDEEEL